MTSQISREPPNISLNSSLSTYSTINSYVLHQIKHNNNLKMQEIKHRIKVTDRTKTGRSYLNYAVRWGRFELVKALCLEMNASLSIKSHCDWNIFHDAAFFNRYEIVEWILRERAGSWQLCIGQDKFGNTPVHIACRRGHEDIALLMASEICKREIARIPKNCMNHTWLHAAIKSNMQQVVKVLLGAEEATQEDEEHPATTAPSNKSPTQDTKSDTAAASPTSSSHDESIDTLMEPHPQNASSLDIITKSLASLSLTEAQKKRCLQFLSGVDAFLTSPLQQCCLHANDEMIGIVRYILCCVEAFVPKKQFVYKIVTYLDETKSNCFQYCFASTSYDTCLLLLNFYAKYASEHLDNWREMNPLIHQNVFGFTVLHVACRFQQVDMLRRFLLSYEPSDPVLETLFYDIDTTVEDVTGKPPPLLATLRLRREVSDILDAFERRKVERNLRISARNVVDLEHVSDDNNEEAIKS